MKFFSTIFTIIFFYLALETIFAQGTIVGKTVHSNALEGNFLEDSPDRRVAIYLPPDYEENLQTFFPVVYLLHGYTHDQTTWLNRGNLGMDIKSILDDLIAQKVIKPMIVVMPNGYNKYQGSWYANSNVTGNWEDYIVKDLIDYIDTNYRTLPQSESRGIAGHSMGGNGAFKIAMKHPEVYCSVFTLSAAFIFFEHSIMGPDYKPSLISATMETDPSKFSTLNWRVRVAIAAAAAFAPNKKRLPYYGDFPVDVGGGLIDKNWEKWLTHDAYTIIKSYKNNLLQLKSIWIECGTNEDLYTSNLKFSQALDSIGIIHVWDDYQGNHVNKIPARIEEKMLPFFSEILASEITSIEISNSSITDKFSLSQNYPNPFNPITAIEYQVPKLSQVELCIYNLLGQSVATLVSEKQAAGSYKVGWDASGFASGIYIYQLTAKGQEQKAVFTKKLVLLK